MKSEVGFKKVISEITSDFFSNIYTQLQEP